VGLVQEYNSDVNKRLVLNSTRVTLVTNPTGIKPTAQFNSLSVYPNPASTTVAVQMDIVNDATVSVSVLNALGQVAIAPTDVLFNSGSHTVNLQVGNLDAGLYFVKVTANGEVNTIPLSIIAK
jgi:pectate lyase